jgi:peptidylprolyl isomerase
MKPVLLAALLVSAASVLMAQTAPTPAAKPVPHPATTAASAIKLPPGVPPARGILKTAFALKYQDVKLGTGAVAESNKVYTLHYTVWLAADGRKLDSSYDHPPSPVFDENLKPVMGPDGKPKQEPAQPFRFLQGSGRGAMPGLDLGVDGMKIGGKRRLFVPWQLAYGAKGRPGPDAAHPGVPPKADLIFDFELVGVNDVPAMAPRSPMGATPGGHPLPGSPGAPGHAPIAPGQPAAPGTTTNPGATVNPSAPATGAPATAPSTTPGTSPGAAPATPPASSTPSAPSSTPAPTTPTTPPQPK